MSYQAIPSRVDSHLSDLVSPVQQWNLPMEASPTAGGYSERLDSITPVGKVVAGQNVSAPSNDNLLADSLSAPWGSPFSSSHSNASAMNPPSSGRLGGGPQNNTQHGDDEQMQAMLRMMMLDEPIHANEMSAGPTFGATFSHPTDATVVPPFLRASPMDVKSPYGTHTPSLPSRRNEAPSSGNNDIAGGNNGNSHSVNPTHGAHIASYFQSILREERETTCTPPEGRFVDLNTFSSPETFIERLTELAQSMKPVLFVYPILDGGTCREFDVSGIATRRFGVFHGQRIRKPYGDFCSITGTIVGVGSDGALWWQRDGDSAAIRLALLPQHMTKFGLPNVIGAAMLGKLDASGVPVPPSYYVLSAAGNNTE